MRNTKLIIVGDSKVGKTTFIHSLLNYPFQENYIPTRSIDKYLIELNQKNYLIELNQKNYLIFDNFQISNSHEGIEGIIVMDSFDNTLKGFENWKFKAVNTGLPIVTVLNKSDISIFKKHNYDFVISSKNKTGIYDVLLSFDKYD
jgi:GTPase SAR1 family protein